MLTLIFVLIAFVLGFAGGRKYPSVLAAAQADLHSAQAFATRLEANIRADLHPHSARPKA